MAFVILWIIHINISSLLMDHQPKDTDEKDDLDTTDGILIFSYINDILILLSIFYLNYHEVRTLAKNGARAYF
jgi:hypothetical protein